MRGVRWGGVVGELGVGGGVGATECSDYCIYVKYGESKAKSMEEDLSKGGSTQ